MNPRVVGWHLARFALVVAATVVTATMLPGVPVVPDLVAPLVVACALVRGPWAGVLVGLVAGWLVDLAPPLPPTPGASALAYAVAGLAAGAFNRPGRLWWALPHVALGCALAAATTVRVVLAALGGHVALGGALVSALLTGLLGVGLVPPLVRLEVLGAPAHRAWLRRPR